MRNKHPHYDLIVEWAKDTSKKWQRKDPGDEMFYDCSVCPSWSTKSTYRLKPRKFIKGHWYPCVDEDGESRVFVFAGKHFKFHLQAGGSNVQADSMQWVGESLGEIKFAG